MKKSFLSLGSLLVLLIIKIFRLYGTKSRFQGVWIYGNSK